MENPVLTLAKLLFGDAAVLKLNEHEGMWSASVEVNGVEEAWGYSRSKNEACAQLVAKLTYLTSEKIATLSSAACRAHGVGWE